MSEYAYFINNKTGDISKPKTRHISAVIDNPEYFGLTKKEIKDIFAKYNEPISKSVEGKAREDILLKVISNGFSRVRLNTQRRNQSWSIQTNKITPQLNDALWIWANKISKDKNSEVMRKFGKYMDVNIYELDKGGGSGKMTKTSLDTIASGAGIKEEVEIFGSDIIMEVSKYVLAMSDEDIINYPVYEERELMGLVDWDEFKKCNINELSESAQIYMLSIRIGK